MPPALSGITYGVDAVEQFQVVTSGGQAELGRALGGYVNVVTKSGTNVLHGNVYDYVRDDRFNAKNALSGTKLPMSQSQYGASLGGPIVQNRTFYFTNVEQRRLDQIRPRHDPRRPTSPPINARLAAAGYQGPLIATGVYPNPVDSTNVLAKVDHQVSGRDQFGVRYSLYDVSSRNSRGAGGLNAPSASAGLDNLDQTIAVSNTLTLSARTVLETRAQFAHGDLKAPPTDPIGPAVSIAGVASFGTSSGSPTRRVNRHVSGRQQPVAPGRARMRSGSASTSSTTTTGSPTRARFAGATRSRRWRTSWPASTTTPASRRRSASSEVSQTNPNLGVYAQDEWKVGSARHAEPRRALRPAVPRDDQHRHQQRLAAPRRGLVAVRLAPHRRPRQRRPVLRPRAAARAGQRAAVGGQHDRPGQPAADRREPVADAGRRAGVPEHPAAASCRRSRWST